jgi:hypothetical protein
MQEEQAKIGLINQQLNLKSTKLRLSQARMAQEQQLAQVQMQDAAISAVDTIRQRVGAHLMENVPPAATASPAQGGGNLGTFGGVPISTRYERSKVSWFGGGSDPEDNGKSAWGGSNNAVPGVAIPSKMLKAIYGHDKGANGQFSDGKVRVKARLADGTEKEMIVPIVDKGTAEWVVQRDGMKLDLNQTLAQQLGGSVSANRLGGIQDVDFELLDKDGNPIGQTSPTSSQSPQGPPNTRALLEDYDEITRLETDPIVANNPLALANLRATKAHIERTPQFQTLVQQRQQEQQDTALGEFAREAITFTPPAQIADFRLSQPGAFAVLQRWDAGMPVTTREKEKALQLLELHGKTFDPSRPNPEIVAAQKTIADSESAIIRANAILTHTPPDTTDPKEKQSRQQARIDIDVAKYNIASALPLVPQAAQRYAALMPQPKAKPPGTPTDQTDQTDPPPPAPIPTRTERETAPVRQQIDQQWTEAKSFIQSNIYEVYPSENDKLALAVDIMRGERVKSPSQGMNVSMETYLTHDVLKLADKGMSLAQVAFEESGNERTGPQSVRWSEVVKAWAKAWAKEYLDAKGYDSKGKPKQGAAPAVSDDVKNKIDNAF